MYRPHGFQDKDQLLETRREFRKRKGICRPGKHALHDGDAEGGVVLAAQHLQDGVAKPLLGRQIRPDYASRRHPRFHPRMPVRRFD